MAHCLLLLSIQIYLVHTLPTSPPPA
uniref:Uncharacterized protein n=1 Tax=Arundo donax TaxID=35708 RepID=A0A0A9HBL4_ARUDO